MKVSAIRQQLHDYIRFAEERKVKAIYTMVEEEIQEKYDIWTKEFMQEIQHRSDDMESGNIVGLHRKKVTDKAKKVVNSKKDAI